MLESAPELGWVIHTAGTVRRLVSPQLWQRGIRVSNAADANAIPVAEYALAMVLLAGDIYDGNWADFRTGLFFREQMLRLRRSE